jgi:hypothetical protein
MRHSSECAGNQNAGCAEETLSKVFGGYVEVVIPDPIPNSEVKHLRANGTARGTAWESRTLPELIMERPQVETPGVFFLCVGLR